MKKVVVFCAECTNKKRTRNTIRDRYKNSPVNIMYTGAQNKNNIRKLLLPINQSSNRNTFNKNLNSLLGGKKADLFIFEGCPLGLVYTDQGGRYVGNGKWANMNAGRNVLNRNIINVVRKHAKNNASVVSPGGNPFLNLSKKLVPKTKNTYWKTFAFK